MSRLRLAVALLAIAGILALTAGMAAAGASEGTAAMDEHELDIDADDTVLRADLHDDGDATFSIEYRIALDDAEDQEAFDELAADIEANEAAFIEQFQDRYGPIVEGAAALTDRDMAMEDPSVTTSTVFTDRQFGVVTYAFTWTGFAVVDGAEIRAGDALEGLFLTDDMTFVVSWPEPYELVEAVPDPDATTDGQLRWSGPRDFGAGEPRVTVSTDAPTGGGLLLPLVIAGVLLLVLVGAGGWYVRTHPERGFGGGGAPVGEDGALLSNEEQVLRLLREHDGRMKQQEVAAELDWTAAKTSKVVGNLRESGELEAFRLGRENVLRLPEEGGETL